MGPFPPPWRLQRLLSGGPGNLTSGSGGTPCFLGDLPGQSFSYRHRSLGHGRPSAPDLPTPARSPQAALAGPHPRLCRGAEPSPKSAASSPSGGLGGIWDGALRPGASKSVGRVPAGRALYLGMVGEETRPWSTLRGQEGGILIPRTTWPKRTG